MDDSSINKLYLITELVINGTLKDKMDKAKLRID